MAVKLVEYRVVWNLEDDEGVIKVKDENGVVTDLKINNSPEFIAALLLLSKSPVLFDSATGEIGCGPRPVGS